MCGVCGCTWVDPEAVRLMADSLRHRGPDVAGLWEDEQVSLGHTRLKVIDLSATGDQPMVSDDGQVVLVYNGEIYNFRELRTELQSLGHRFRGTSDTEVFLRAYEQWGHEAYRRFNGMWAAAVYDRRNGTVTLSRDRIGVKPLHFCVLEKGIAFASELRAILTLPGVSREIDQEAVDLLLSAQFVPSPWTLFRQIRKVEPRHYMVWHLRERRLERHCYYEIPQYRPIRDRGRLIREGRELFEDAVRLRMVADVPLGAFLSGGIDSTAVVAVMKRFTPADQIHTVGVGFDLPGLDESPYIELAGRELGTRQHLLPFRVDDVERLLEVVAEHYDEPIADHSSLPTWILCEETRRWMTVALSGDGGDEAFGGYSSRQVVVTFQRLRRIPRPLRWAAHEILRRVRGYDWSKVGRLAEALRVSLLPAAAFAGELGASMVYRPSVSRRWTRERLEELLRLSGGNLVEAMLKFDIYYNRLGDNYAAKVDRMSMAHALEVRSPLMDYRLMEFASKVPVDWKISSRDTKIIFKEMLRGEIPDAILDRPKHGFAAPLSAWVGQNLPRIERSVKTLHDARVLSDAWAEYLRKEVLPKPGTPYAKELLKRVVFLAEWHQRWVVRA